MIVILPNIRSVHNVGSIFRTSDAAGIEKIYLTGYTPSPLDKEGKPLPRFKKVSLGSEKNIAWERKKDTIKLIKNLKNKGYIIIAAELTEKSIPYTNIKDFNNDKIVLIMGHELDGVENNILNICDYVIHIPMEGIKESLNVSVAYGIIVYYLKSLNK